MRSKPDCLFAVVERKQRRPWSACKEKKALSLMASGKQAWQRSCPFCC